MARHLTLVLATGFLALSAGYFLFHHVRFSEAAVRAIFAL